MANNYIGETGRPLHARINEHMRSLINPSKKSYSDAPLARHRVSEHHNKVPSIKVEILAIAGSTIKRKVMEAMWIQREHPQLNIKKEMEEAMKLLY